MVICLMVAGPLQVSGDGNVGRHGQSGGQRRRFQPAGRGDGSPAAQEEGRPRNGVDVVVSGGVPGDGGGGGSGVQRRTIGRLRGIAAPLRVPCLPRLDDAADRPVSQGSRGVRSVQKERPGHLSRLQATLQRSAQLDDGTDRQHHGLSVQIPEPRLSRCHLPDAER